MTKAVSCIIEIDGAAHSVIFQGFDMPMAVNMPDGEILHFLPWSYGEHMAALQKSLKPVAQGLDLDIDKFCRYVFERSGLSYLPDLKGLALWWACGGDGYEPQNNEPLNLGPTRVYLKQWTAQDRLKSLAHSIVTGDGGEFIDIVVYLDAMVRASIKKFEPEMSLTDLDPAATSHLLDAVISLNIPENLLPPAFTGLETIKEHALKTLQLCASLGWTPSQVWETPAPEIDRLLALADYVQLPPQKMASGLAACPDAVVINFEED